MFLHLTDKRRLRVWVWRIGHLHAPGGFRSFFARFFFFLLLSKMEASSRWLFIAIFFYVNVFQISSSICINTAKPMIKRHTHLWQITRFLVCVRFFVSRLLLNTQVFMFDASLYVFETVKIACYQAESTTDRPGVIFQVLSSVPLQCDTTENDTVMNNILGLLERYCTCRWSVSG
jgi:hypothetical protein